MNNFIPINQLKIDSNLFNFVNTEILPGIDIKQDQFWKNFSTIIQELDPINKTLLEKRKNFQLKLDNWHVYLFRSLSKCREYGHEDL